VSLTAEQFARAAALELRQLKLRQLERMSYRQLRALLAGDPAEALEWVLSAAEHGVPAAQLRLGRMLLEGLGVPRDEKAAFEWFSRAARVGNAEAANMVGRCHENGWGVPVDLACAALHYRSAAAAGYDWGEYNFGNLLFDGRGIERDVPQALYWYLRAARQGHGRAMNLIGRCLEEGWGCPRSPQDAAYWYRRSAEAGYFRGQLNHALVLSEQGDVEDAARWFWKSAITGDSTFRRIVTAALANATHPALLDVAARIREISSASALAGATIGDPQSRAPCARAAALYPAR
jgi:uncharacterized protein